MKKLPTIILVTIVIVFCVVFSILTVNNYIYKNQTNELLTQANQAALFLDAEDVLSFSKNADDLNNEKYKNILEKLEQFRSMNPQIRFLYILGYDKDINKQFFFLDTEPITSKDYSSPGQVFEDTRQIDIDNFLKGESYVDGPYKDSWGEWYSAYSPIKNSNGETIALVGLDVSVSIWRSQIIFSSMTISLVGLLISAVVLFLIFILYKKQASIKSLEKEAGMFSSKESKFKELKKLVHAGQFNIYFPDRLISLDSELAPVFSSVEGQKISFESFLNFIHNDDKKAFMRAINEIATKQNTNLDINIRVLSGEAVFDQYHVFGQANDDTHPERFVFAGVMQTIGNK